MTRRKLPRVFRITAALMLAAIVVGGWWQRQPVGATGLTFLAAVARGCPAAMPTGLHSDIADTAHALDQWDYARLGNLTFRDGRDRCAREVAR